MEGSEKEGDGQMNEHESDEENKITESEKIEHKRKNDEQQRTNVAQEIMHTEASYIQDLSIAIKVVPILSFHFFSHRERVAILLAFGKR